MIVLTAAFATLDAHLDAIPGGRVPGRSRHFGQPMPETGAGSLDDHVTALDPADRR